MSLLIVGLLIFPGIAWIENICGDSGTGGRNIQAKDWIGLCGDLFQFSVDRRAHHCSRIGDIDALTDAVRATSPASIDKIATNIVAFDAFAQQIRVLSRL